MKLSLRFRFSLSIRPDRSRAVSVWLWGMAALVFAMVVVGGATRLTDSGLSITEWRPVTGAVPPLSHAAWLAEFDKYQRIPEYRFQNAGMSLAQFQSIYWWEWAHRFLGRVIGLAFALPLIGFVLARRIPRGLAGRCWLLLALGGLQGLVGWWMVTSGLSERVDVAPERLTVHLGLALFLFAVLVWTALDAWSGPRPAGAGSGRWARPAWALLAAVFVQCLLGGLVAGNDAGRIYTDWPLMGGRLVPSDYGETGGLWSTLAHDLGAVQLHHRLWGYLVFAGAWAFSAWTWTRPDGRSLRPFTGALAALVTAQMLLGIATLMTAVPLHLGAAHQAGAVLVLAMAVALAWKARRVPGAEAARRAEPRQSPAPRREGGRHDFAVG